MGMAPPAWVKEVYPAILEGLLNIYRELDGVFWTLSFGKGWVLRHESNEWDPNNWAERLMPFPRRVYDLNHPSDKRYLCCVESSARQENHFSFLQFPLAAEQFLEEVKKCQTVLENAPDTPALQKKALPFLVKDAERCVKEAIRLGETASRLDWQGDKDPNGWESVRSDAIMMYAACRAASERLHKERALDMYRVEWEAALLREKARTEEAKAEMFLAKGDTKAANEAKRRAEDARQEAERKEAERIGTERIVDERINTERKKAEKAEILKRLDTLQVTSEQGRDEAAAAHAVGARALVQSEAIGEKLDGVVKDVGETRDEVREAKGLLVRFWDWFKSLTGWPGRKPAKGLAVAKEVAKYVAKGMIQEGACREYLIQHGNKNASEKEVSNIRGIYLYHKKAGNL